MQLVSFHESEAGAFLPKSRLLVRRVPFVVLLREFLRQEKGNGFRLLEEDEFPESLARFFQGQLSHLSHPSAFFFEDRRELRLAVVVASASRGPASGNFIKSITNEIQGLVWGAGFDEKDAFVLPFERELPGGPLQGMAEPICLLAWRSEPLLGEAPISGSNIRGGLYRELRQQVCLSEAPSQGRSHPEPPLTEAVGPSLPRPKAREKGTVPSRQTASGSKPLQTSILGRTQRPESRKYYLKEEAGGLRFAAFYSRRDASGAAIRFCQSIEQGLSTLVAHRSLLEGMDDENTAVPSLSLEIAADGRFQCIKRGLPSLLWRSDERSCRILPDTVRAPADPRGPKIQRLTGRLMPGDGLLVLVGEVEREHLMALARAMQIASLGKGHELLKRAVSRRQDELGIGRSIWFGFVEREGKDP